MKNRLRAFFFVLMLRFMFGRNTTRRLTDLLICVLGRLATMEKTLMAKYDELQAEVERQTSVTQSVVTLVKNLADQVENNKEDPAALQKLVDQIRGNDTTLADAVTANTPADPGVPGTGASGATGVGDVSGPTGTTDGGQTAVASDASRGTSG